MPELKHNFLQGKMNKDLDERLVPQGEYRDALNVEVTTSEASESGTVQNIKGNIVVSGSMGLDTGLNNYNTANAITVGSIADESSKSIFNFVHKACDFYAAGYYASGTQFTGIKCDAITRYVPNETQESGTSYPMVVDIYEVRLLAEVQSSADGIIKPTMFDETPVGAQTIYNPLGVRVGMRVQLVGPDGLDLYVGQEIVVTAINNALSENEVSIQTSSVGFGITYTQTYIDAGFVFKFTAPRILKFRAGTIETESNVANTPISNTPLKTSITGINIEDGILFYTDGRNEPKRIVLERFELNYDNNNLQASYFNLPVLFRHSNWRYRNTDGLFIHKALEEKHITVIRPNPLEPPVVKPTFTTRVPGPILFGTAFLSNVAYQNTVISAIGMLPLGTGDLDEGINFTFSTSDADGANILLEPGAEIVVRSATERVHWKSGDVIEFTGAISSAVVTCTIHAVDTTLAANQNDNGFDVFTLSFMDASEGYYSTSPKVYNEDPDDEAFGDFISGGVRTLNSSIAEAWVGILKEKDTIYSEKFIYFAYRYKYLDNERSCISPYSKAIFSPGLYSYNSLAGFNFGMNNRLKTVEVKDFIPINIPDDVMEVEILLKESGSDNLYLVKNIKRHTSDWDLSGDTYNGRVLIESELFGPSIPSSQLLRIYDGVPKKAETQEFSGSRLLFGNYTEGYNLLDHDLSYIDPLVNQNFDITHEVDDFSSSFESENTAQAGWLTPNNTNHLSVTTPSNANFDGHNKADCQAISSIYGGGSGAFVGSSLNNPWFTGLYDFYEGNGGADGPHWEDQEDIVFPARKKFDADWWGKSDFDVGYGVAYNNTTFLRFGALSILQAATGGGSQAYHWHVLGPPHTPVVNAGINAVVESTSGDPGTNYNNFTSYFADQNYDNPRGPYYVAPVSGYYTFKVSARLAFNDALVRSGGGAGLRSLSEVFRMAMCLVKCDEEGKLLLSSGNFEEIGNITTNNTDRPIWCVKQGGNVLAKGSSGRVYGLRSTIFNSDVTYAQAVEDDIPHHVYNWGSKKFSINTTVYLESGDRVAAAMPFPYTYLSESTRNATFNPPGGGAPGGLDWRLQFTTNNSVSNTDTFSAPGTPLFPNQYPADYNFGFQSRDASFEIVAAPVVVQQIAASQGKESVKSGRTYQTGVVYLDEYGRESTVLVDEKRIESLTKYNCQFANRIRVQIEHNAPYWAKYYKIFIKEIAQEYYNIPLYKAYAVDQDDEQLAQFVWLSFNSNERDKVKLEDSLVLKKEHGTSNAVTDKNARWRIIDIVDSPRKVEDADPDMINNQSGFALGSLTVAATADEIEGKFFVKIQADGSVDQYLANPGFGGGLTATDKILSGACFEVETPRQIDLELFYEISQAYPIFLSKKDASMYIKKGSWLTFPPLQSSQAWSESQLQGPGTQAIWENFDGNAEVISITGADTKYGYCRVGISQPLPGYIMASQDQPVPVVFNELNPAIEKGSYVAGWITSTHASNSNYIDIYPFTHNLSTTPNALRHTYIRLPWFNCFAFGNGVESDRIRDDFNAGVIYPYTAAGKASGFKATIPDADYSEVTKKNDIIFSQIYNDASNVARYNEFLLAEDITKQLNSEYGSIQKLYTRQGDVIAFCESKVVKILANKDALFNADGNPQLLSSTNVLGEAIPFIGDYGISKNPESFAVEEFRIYFTDRDRGAVCRLSRDGITAISDNGMKDWFNDNLQKAQALVGSYDGKKNEYNLTIHSLTSSNSSKNVYTLGFSEAVKGWTSFKSFIQESGVSLSNNYYTFKKGKAWLHHPDLTDEDRCNFYGIQNKSTLTALFNDIPGTVKLFKTINYEGTQSKVVSDNVFCGEWSDYNDSFIFNQAPSSVAWYKFKSCGSSAQWDDLSGNANHLTQTTVNDQPTYNSTTGAFAFTPSTEFDFTTKLNLDARTIIFAIDFTMPKTEGHAYYHTLMHDSEEPAMLLEQSAYNNIRAYLGDETYFTCDLINMGGDGGNITLPNGNQIITKNLSDTKFLLTITLDTQAVGGVIKAYVNNIDISNPGTCFTSTPESDLGNGTYDTLGKKQGGTGAMADMGFQGNIYEMIIFDSVLSESDLTNVQNEIIDRVGIPHTDLLDSWGNILT